MRRLQFAALAFLLTTRAGAQSAPVCLGQPATGKQLICLIPGVYGPTGLNLANTAHKGHFEDSFLASTTSTPLSAAIGAQSSLLPLASPSSGLTFTWDPIAKAFAPSTDSLGPILGERADTVGKHRIFLGFSYQYFNFDRAWSASSSPARCARRTCACCSACERRWPSARPPGSPSRSRSACAGARRRSPRGRSGWRRAPGACATARSARAAPGRAAGARG